MKSTICLLFILNTAQGLGQGFAQDDYTDSADFDFGHMFRLCLQKNDCVDQLGYSRQDTIFRSIKINAAVEDVWAAIVDLKNYSQWNPFMPQLDADLRLGGVVVFKVRLGKVIRFKEKLYTVAFEPQRRWCWSNKILFKRFGISQRCRWLKKLEDGSTMYFTSEKFKGPAAAMIKATTFRQLSSGVEAEAKSLKGYVESYIDSAEVGQE